MGAGILFGADADDRRPAEMLEGMTVGDGWTVDSIIVRPPSATGGYFSTGYRVSHPDGRTGFLKAMDYLSALSTAGTSVDVVKDLTTGFVFERDICLKCRDTGVTRVVSAIDHGVVMGKAGALGRVDYLIFEMADGDIRAHLDQSSILDIPFALRSLHGIAAALKQLHSKQMAHQDLKPSNVLLFESATKSKLGDLGRAWASGITSPFDNYRCAGDRTYAPPELLLNVAVDEESRRYGYDLYLLGSMVVFVFTRHTMNAMIRKHFPAGAPIHSLGNDYFAYLPYIQEAFHSSLIEFESLIENLTPSPVVNVLIKSKLASMVRQLYEPDFRARGDHSRGKMNRFSLERHLSTLDLLRIRAHIASR